MCIRDRLTLAGDAGKALVSVLLGRLLLGEDGAYLAGLFCILGHIAPVYYLSLIHISFAPFSRFAGLVYARTGQRVIIRL